VTATDEKHGSMWRSVICVLALSCALTPLLLADFASAAPTLISEFSEGLSPNSQPEDIVAGPDGNVWFIDGDLNGAIGRITPTGAITLFSKGLNAESTPVKIVAGPDGNLWFTDRGSFSAPKAIGQITPSGTITLFTAGLGANTRPRDIVVGSDGNLWFTANGTSPAIGTITPDGMISTFSLPGPPREITIGPDGNPWFTYAGASPAIGRVAQGEGKTTITLFSAGLNPSSEPEDIIVGPDGNLWFVDESESIPAIGRVEPSGTITEFNAGLSSGASPNSIVVGPDENLWFTDLGGAIGRITPGGSITQFSGGLNEKSAPFDIVAGPDGNLWFTDLGNISAVGKITESGTITEFKVDSSSNPWYIVAGFGGTLWFSSGGANHAIGRIIPGDDPPAGGGIVSPQLSICCGIPPHAGQKSPGKLALADNGIAVQSNGNAAIALTCLEAFRCGGRVTLTAMQSPKNRRKHLQQIATTAFSIPTGSTRLKVRINRAGRTLLRARDGRLRASLALRKTLPGPKTVEHKRVHLFQNSQDSLIGHR
jgi:streptogramin lyase